MDPLDTRQIIVTVNGPGEISGWLYPFVTVFRQRAPDVRVCVAVLPSVFASGAEASVVQAIAGIDAVASVRETMRHLYGGPRPPGFEKGVPGCLLHLGGEPFLSFLLARRFHYPCLAYLERSTSHRPWFARIYLTDEAAQSRWSSNGRARVIGNMMVDVARMRSGHRASSRTPSTVGIFPGSRFTAVKHFLPFYVKAAGLVVSRIPQARWLVAKADFISLEELRRAAEEEEGRLAEGESARWEAGHPFGSLVSPRGVRLEILPPSAVMAQADLAVTMPGTNTAELAALGVPMLVLAPMHFPEFYPFPGLIGYLHAVPVVGRGLKRFLIRSLLRRERYFALPNRKQQREVVPEIVGVFTADQVAAKLVEMLTGPLERMSADLRSTMGPPGAAGRLVDEVLTFLRPPASA